MTQKQTKKKEIEDSFLKFIAQTIKRFYPSEKVKVYLYGSRARGDFSATSDYDLAFEIPTGKSDAEFLLTLQEEAPTLCGIDALNINQVGEQLRKEILKEGKLIYET